MKPELRLLFEARVTLSTPISVGDTPDGVRRVVPITGGTFSGPRLRGTVLAGGADWQHLRRDGVLIIEAQYLLKTHDDVVLQVNNQGVRHGPPAVIERLAAGLEVDPAQYYFRATPTFCAPAGAYDWLNSRIFVCSGARFPDAVGLWFYELS